MKNKFTATKFIFSLALFNLFAYNIPLYLFAFDKVVFLSFNGILILFCLSAMLYLITVFLLFLIATISYKIMKYFSIIFILINSIGLYFIITYQVLLDRTMMGNIFNTNIVEAVSYFHFNIFIYFFLLGILPAYFIYKVDIKKPNRLKMFSIGAGSLLIWVLIMYLSSTTWLWFDKYAKQLGGLIMPWSYIINSTRHLNNQLKSSKKQILLPKATFNKDENTLVVLIIGESARANNFSLYGYKKETNPNLKKLNIKVLKNTTSTTTYTTASVSSMLSHNGSTNNDYEPLPSYLQRHGVDVIWKSNNWGEPPIKVSSYQNYADLKKKCKGKECIYDGLLLTGLKDEIINIKKNRFIVLHTNGSHGPTYYKKYPPQFEIFKPICKSVDLSSCKIEDLINAYDNTILYTDYLISKIIKILKKNSSKPTLLIYISDHGESLGEYGLYLHGTPYSIAPDFQKKIPFLIWSSKSFQKKYKIDINKKSYGQNNIFHTIISAFELNSTIYDKNLDVLIPVD